MPGRVLSPSLKLTRYSVLAADKLREQVTFDLLTLVSGHTWGHMVNPSTNFEDPALIRS